MEIAMSKCKASVLVVDDQPSILDLCRELLLLEGYEVETAMDGEEAVGKAGERCYDILLTDIHMSGMDGIEMFTRIREVQEDILGIIMTGYATFDYAMQALKAGFVGFVLKPFSANHLLTEIQKALDRKNLLLENHRLKTLIPLFELSKSFMANLNLEDLLQQIVQTCVSETRAEKASLMLLDESGEYLYIAAAVGLGEGILQDSRVRVGEGISGYVAKTRCPVILNPGDSEVDSQLRRVMQRSQITSALCHPLLVQDKLIGVLNLTKFSSDTPFHKGDLGFIAILAGQAAAAIENAKLYKDLRESYFNTIVSLNHALEAKDPYTRGHSERVARYSVLIGEKLGLSQRDLDRLEAGSRLHDIGKIGIPDRILLKQSRLTKEEFEMVKLHPKIGAAILEPLGIFQDLIPIVKYHHEAWDGSGYNEGLKEEEIPFDATIVAVADTVDAMTSSRPYRQGVAFEKVVSEICRCKGRQFRPDVVEAFLEVVEERGSGMLIKEPSYRSLRYLLPVT